MDRAAIKKFTKSKKISIATLVEKKNPAVIGKNEFLITIYTMINCRELLDYQISDAMNESDAKKKRLISIEKSTTSRKLSIETLVEEMRPAVMDE